MNINGKQIALEIMEGVVREVLALPKKPKLAVVYMGTNPVIDNFVGIKKRVGEKSGIDVEIEALPETSTEEELSDLVDDLSMNELVDAIIIQLPLPDHIDAQKVLDRVPRIKDVDVLAHGTQEDWAMGLGEYEPPVAGAIIAVLEKIEELDLSIADTVIIGAGDLVGKPIAAWFKNKSFPHKVLIKGDSLAESLPNADVIISGAGVPGLVSPELVKSNVVLIDAGTSEQGGKVVGDIDPACADKALFITPTPGGIGPITVAVLMRNVVRAAKNQS